MSDQTFETILQQALQLNEADQLRLIVMLQASLQTDTTKTLAQALERSNKRAAAHAKHSTDERRRCAEHSVELDALDLNDPSIEMTPEWKRRLENWIDGSSFSITDTH